MALALLAGLLLSLWSAPRPVQAAVIDGPHVGAYTTFIDTAPRVRPRHWAWAQLMQRAFGVDVLACPRCTGRLRLVATVEDPHAIRAILESLGLRAEVPQPDPAHPPPVEARGLPGALS